MTDTTNGGTYDKEPVSINPAGTKITIRANFTSNPATWTARILGPTGLNSSPLSFSVVAPVSAAPVVSTVTHSVLTAATTAQTITLDGTDFRSGAVVEVTNLTTGAKANASILTAMSTQITASYAFNAVSIWGIRVINPDGTSSQSYDIQVNAPAATVLPVTPIAVSPGSVSAPGEILADTTASLSWNSVASATYYAVAVRDLNSGELVTDTTLAGTSYDLNLIAGKQYRWNVAACNSAGCSAYASPLYFKTPGIIVTIPAVPTGTSPGTTYTPGPTMSGNSVTLSWNASSGATQYGLGVRDMTTNTLVVSTTVTGTSYTANLIAGKQYRWNVAACNSAGCSNYTTPLYFQTPTSVLTVNGIASSYSTTTTPYQPTINLSGSGFYSITQINWNCTMPNGTNCTGSPYIWTSANWNGKFSRISDSSGSVSPTLLAGGDPAGTYNWSVTFSGGGQSVIKSFTVTKN